MPRTRPHRWLLANRVATYALAVGLGLLLTGCGGRRAERSATVPVMAPPPAQTAAPHPNTTVIAAATPAETQPLSEGVTAPPPPAPAPSLVDPDRIESALSANRSLDWNPTQPDAYGFDGDRYLNLLTAQEMDILRLRARGDTASHLSRFLSEKERENLRRRDAELTEIGAEPLQIGE